MNARVPSTRAMALEGVNAARTLFESNECIFQEINQQNDFGKDAYVDLTVSGVVTPVCVALQIKAGASYKSVDGDYRLPLGGHADSWRRSTVPVFGLIYDPADCLLRWVDLTSYLRANPEKEDGHVKVPRRAVLDREGLLGEFAAAASKYTLQRTGSIALQLLSGGDQQWEAVFDAFALGRSDPRYLVLLRRLLIELEPRAARQAIFFLSHAAPHPDIFWIKDKNWIPPLVEQRVQESFRWLSEEVAHMLSIVGAEDWGRGTLGQSLDVLLYEDPDVLSKLRAAVTLLLEAGEVDNAVRAVTLVLSHSRDETRELSLLLHAHPELSDDEWFASIAAEVRETGRFNLYF